MYKLKNQNNRFAKQCALVGYMHNEAFSLFQLKHNRVYSVAAFPGLYTRLDSPVQSLKYTTTRDIWVIENNSLTINFLCVFRAAFPDIQLKETNECKELSGFF